MSIYGVSNADFFMFSSLLQFCWYRNRPVLPRACGEYHWPGFRYHHKQLVDTARTGF